MSFTRQQSSTPGNEHLTPNNAASSREERPLQSTPHQAEMVGDLTGVGGGFGSQLAWDTEYASAEAFSEATEASQDAASQALAIPAPDEQRLNQRKPREQQPDVAQWDKHKSRIRSFYMDQNYTLAATMQIMEALYQFHASEKGYKDKFKQWQWSKNLRKATAARMITIAKQREPKPTVFLRHHRKWTIEQVKKSYSRASGGQDSSTQEDCSTHDDFTCETPPSSGITDNDSTLENPHGTGGACVDTAEHLCKFLDARSCRINSASEAHSLVQEARKAIEEGRHQEAEASLRDALSFYSLLSPISRKTLDTGYLLASLYIKTGRIKDAHCILDWMTKKHGDTKSCNSKIVAHVHSTIAFFRRIRRDEEAELLTYRLLKHHQTTDTRHFILHNSSIPRIGSHEMIEDLLTLSNPDDLAAMLDILKELSIEPNNHKLLQDLLPLYIQECDQRRIEELAIPFRCTLAAILAENAQFARAIHIVGEAEGLLNQLWPLEPSTLKLIERVAFTFVEINDLGACFRVLGTALENMDVNKVNDIVSGYYRASVCDFLISTVSGLHEACTCEQSRGWMNEAHSRSETLFGANHECTKQIKQMMDTCDTDSLTHDLDRMMMDASY